MRRVAYMTPLYFDDASHLGGGERYPANLGKALAASGEYEVDIVSYGARSVVQKLAPGVRLRVLAAASRPAGAERLSWEVLEVLGEADLVHLHQIFCRASEVALLTARLLDKPVCATDHGGATSSVGSSLRMLDLIDRVISQSRFAAALLHPFTDRNIEVVPGGVDDAFFTPPAEALPRDRVVFVGRLLPHKGIDRLIAALPPEVPLAVCGRPYDPSYYLLLRTLAHGKPVSFHTAAGDAEVRELYRRALAVVLPSVYVDFAGQSHPWSELMGLSLIEGMACGAPAICSRVGGMPEYVEHGVTGFVFDELAELSEHLVQLARDPQRAQAIGATGRASVEARFGLRAAGSGLRSIYDELLEGALPHEGARAEQSLPA